MPFSYLSKNNQNKLMQAATGLTLATAVFGLLITFYISAIIKNGEERSRIADLNARAFDLSKRVEMTLLNSSLRIQSMLDYFGDTKSSLSRQQRIVEQTLNNTIFQRMALARIENLKSDDGMPVVKRLLVVRTQSDDLKLPMSPEIQSEDLRRKIQLMHGKNMKSVYSVNYFNGSATLHLLVRSSSSDKEFLIFSTPLEKFVFNMESKEALYLLMTDELLNRKVIVSALDKARFVSAIDENGINEWFKANPQYKPIGTEVEISTISISWLRQDEKLNTPMAWIVLLTGALITTLVTLLIRFILVQNQRVAALVVERTVDLESALLQANEANMTKTRFLANVSHELRTPLNIILGMIEMVETQVKDPKVNEFIQAIHTSGEHLLRLITDLLHVAKKDQHGEEMTIRKIPIKCPLFFEEVVRMVRLGAHEKKLDLKFNIAEDVPACFRGDPVRVRQILINLLRNSIKYTVTGYIELKVQVINFQHDTSHDQVTLRLTVSDSGVGIPKSKRHQIFERFLQLDSAKVLSQGGVGLGLSIVKDLVASMNGNISVDSEEGVGTTFNVDLSFQVIDGTPWIKTITESVDTSMRMKIVTEDKGLFSLFHENLSRVGVRSELISKEEFISQISTGSMNANVKYLCDTGLDIKWDSLSDQWASQIVLFGKEIEYGQLSTPRKFRFLDCCPVISTDLYAIAGFVNEKVSVLAETEKTIKAVETNRISDKPLTVLIADDDASNRQLYQAYFAGLGWLLHFAENGEEAYKIYIDKVPDIIIADLRMPVMDGLEMTQKIRSMEDIGARKPTPIFLVTADALTETAEKAFQMRVTKFLTKPIRRQKIIQAVQEVMMS